MIFETYIQSYVFAFNGLEREIWNYQDGCVLTAMQELYEVEENPLYYQSISAFMEQIIGEDGCIRSYNAKDYNLDKIPPGRVLFFLYGHTKEKKYRYAIENLMEQLRSQPRTSCGSFWHKKIYPYQIWLDELYMGMPFYALYEKCFGDGNGYSDIIKQFQNARQCLYDRETGLYYHAYDESRKLFWADRETGCSANIWSRALGWFFMALVDCYEIIPDKEQAGKAYLKFLFCDLAERLLKYQDSDTGLFYQLTVLQEEPENYLETSASAMFAYGFLKGCRLGLLETEIFRAKGEEILLSLAAYKFSYRRGKLELTGMCVGAGLGPETNRKRDGSKEYYLSEPVISDEKKGTAAVMLAYGEWMKLRKKQGDRQGNFLNIQIYNNCT